MSSTDKGQKELYIENHLLQILDFTIPDKKTNHQLHRHAQTSAGGLARTLLYSLFPPNVNQASMFFTSIFTGDQRIPKNSFENALYLTNIRCFILRFYRQTHRFSFFPILKCFSPLFFTRSEVILV